MTDKYLERLKGIERGYDTNKSLASKSKKESSDKSRFEEFKEGYKKDLGERDPSPNLVVKDGEIHYTEYLGPRSKPNVKYHKLTPKKKGEVLKTANDLMNYGIEHRSTDAALQSLDIYEKLGIGNRGSVKRRLLKVLEKTNDQKYAKEVEGFLKRNPESEEGKGLEKKIIPIIASFSLIASLFLLSPNITGNVFGNSNNSGSNVFGVILLILGLIGIFSYFKKR